MNAISKAFLRRLLAAVVPAVLLFASAESAFAASGTWISNSSSTWSGAANWNPAVVPGTAAGDVVSITGTNITATRTVSINTNVTLGTLNIGDSDASHSYILARTSGTFTLNNSGSGAQINQVATSAGDTISAPFVLADNLAITNNALTNAIAPVRILTISGSISETGGARTLGKSGTATVVLSGTASYTGATTINAGILQFAKTASLYNSNTASWTAANIVTGSGATLGLNVGGAGEFTTGNVTTLLTNLGGLGGSITNNGLRAGSAIGFDTTNATGGVTIADNIRNSTGTGGGAIGVTKLGSGTMTLSGVSGTAANNYTGATTIDRGTLVLADGANLSGGLVFGAVIGGTSTGSLDLTNGSATFTSLNVRTDSTSGTNTITIGNGKALTVNGNVQVGYNGSTTSGNATTRLTVTGSSAGSDGTWNVTSSNGTFRVGDSGGSTVRPPSQATLDMSGLNSFTADLRTGASGSTGGTFAVGSTSGAATGGNVTATLAVNSTIKANALTISNVSGGPGTVSLKLGSGNQVINANNIAMSQGSRDASSLSFNTVSGSLTVRGAGSSGRANLTMLTGITTAFTTTSTFDVTGHQADLLLGAVKVLDSTAQTTSSANNYSAFFGFDQGTLDATSFLIGSKSGGTLSNILSSTVSLGSSSNSAASATLGTVTIANMTSGTTVSGTLNGTLNITGNATSVGITSLTVANYTSGSTTATANGLVSISGGTTTITNGITLANRATAGTTNGTLSITGGSLSVGTAGVSGTNGIFTSGAGGVGTSTLTLDGGSLNLNGNSIGGAGQLIAAAFRSGTLSNVGGINNGAGLTKSTAGTLILAGVNTYSGGTQIDAGTLVANGSVAGNVTVASGAALGGSGSFSGVLSGDGQIGPGNSPGILTVDSLQPTSTTSFAFELSGTGSPTWANAAGSVNDVLRLTNAASPFAGPLAGTNVVNVYLGVTSLSVNDTFLGGFFTDKSSSFDSSISAATYNFFVLGSGSGTAATYNGQSYYALDTWAAANVPGYTGVTVSTASVPTANFASGNVVNGQVTQFVIVPEPSAIVAAGFGIAMVGWSLWKRRRLA